MKRLVAIACVFALAVYAVGVQAATKCSLGVKGGVNLADLSGDDAPDDTSMKAGVMGGAVFDVDFTDQFGARVEGLYTMKGAKADSATVERKLKVNYVEFPVLFVAKFPAGEKFKVNVFAGPTIGFNVKAEAEEGGVTEDIGDEVKSTEFGATFGAGGEIAMTSFSIVFDARYALGATSIFEDVGTISIDVKNRGIGIMAGVTFPIGGGAQ